MKRDETEIHRRRLRLGIRNTHSFHFLTNTKIDIQYEVIYPESTKREGRAKQKMGVTWSKSRLISNNTKIVIDCDFPRDRPTQKKFWALWKEHKEALKADGFSIRKNEATESWGVAYWHTVDNNSHVKDDKTGKPQWRITMERKMERWIGVLETIEIEPDQYSKPKKTVANMNAPIPAAVETKYEASDLDLDSSMEMNDQGEVISKPAVVGASGKKASAKPTAAPAPKPPNKPIRVDISKLLDDDGDY